MIGVNYPATSRNSRDRRILSGSERRAVLRSALGNFTTAIRTLN
jgi:hypothetical protein